MKIVIYSKGMLLAVLMLIQFCFAEGAENIQGHVLPIVDLSALKQRLSQVVGSENETKPSMIKGSIEINDNEDEVPEFRIYFNGMETLNNREGFYSFPLEDSMEEYSLILTKNVNWRVEKNNTLKELRIKNSKDYRCFSLRRTGTDNSLWSWEESLVKADNFVVPYKSILLFVSPRCLDKLSTWKVKLSEKFVPIPRIILKGEYRSWIDRQAKKSLLYSLDLKPFHERIREEHKDIPGKAGEMVLMR